MLAVPLLHDDRAHLSGATIGKQTLQCRPLKCPAAHTGVQLCLADDEPASVRIAPYHVLGARPSPNGNDILS